MRALHAVSPLLLAALLAAPASAAAATEAEAGAGRCDQARRQERARIGAEHATCEADLDCVPFEPELAGCGVWVSRTARPPDELARSLEAACAGWAPAASCAPAVGACVAGRCGGKPPRGGDCAAARAALAKRLEEDPGSCDENAACVAVILPGATSPVAAARIWPDLAARELRGVEEACGGAGDPMAAAASVPITRFPACDEGTCRLRADTPTAARWRRPALVEPGCMKDAVAAAAASARGDAAVRFTVARNGRAYAVRFEGSLSDEARALVAEAVTGCRWRPGATQAEDPARIEMRLPLKH